MRYVRRVTLVNGRVSEWRPAPPGTETDGKEHFWSDDPMFAAMTGPGDDDGVRDRHGNRQWELKNGKVTHKKDKLTSEQRRGESLRLFRAEYPVERSNEITADAEEARLDDAPKDDPAFLALKTMQNRKREILAKVDGEQ